MDHDKSPNMDQIRMDSPTGVFAAIVAPARGSGAAVDLQLPRTRQDVVLEETSRPAQASASHPRVTSNIDSPNQEDEEWPLKWPIAPQYCRRWGKPEPYVIFDFPMRLSDGVCG